MISHILQRWRKSRPPKAAFEGNFPFFDVFEAIIQQTMDIENVEFLQVGASDGVTNDPINSLVRRYNWSGTLIEPSERTFKRLTRHYADRSNLRFMQCIVTDKEGLGSQVLYELSGDICSVSHWAEQSASTKRATVEGFLTYYSQTEAGKNIVGDRSSLLREVTVPAYHFCDLIELLELERLDVLVIDTMGLDAKLLETFPFKQFKPKLIMFEHALLEVEEKLSVLHLLANHGYSFVKFAVDTIAVLDDKPRHWDVSEW